MGWRGFVPTAGRHDRADGSLDGTAGEGATGVGGEQAAVRELGALVLEKPASGQTIAQSQTIANAKLLLRGVRMGVTSSPTRTFMENGRYVAGIGINGRCC